jgi:hypothetical protein
MTHEAREPIHPARFRWSCLIRGALALLMACQAMTALIGVFCAWQYYVTANPWSVLELLLNVFAFAYADHIRRSVQRDEGWKT